MSRRYYDPAGDYYRQRGDAPWGPFGPLGDFHAFYVELAKPNPPPAPPREFSYAEAAAVPVRTRAFAELALTLACRDLGLKGVALRFFEMVIPSWHSGPIVHADERRLEGWTWAHPDRPKEVWVEAGLDPAAAARVVGHECRHCEQQATFGPCRTEKVRAARDRDAEAYAEEFAARYISDETRERSPEPESRGSASAWRQLPTFLRGSRRVGGLSLDPLPLAPGMPWPSTMSA